MGESNIQVVTDVNLTRDDLVAVAVAEVEVQLRNRRKELEGLLAARTQQIAEAETAHRKLMRDTIEAKGLKQLETVIKPLEKLGMKGIEPRCTNISCDERRTYYNLTVGGKRQAANAVQISMDIPTPGTLKTSHKKLDDLRQEKTRLEQDLFKVRRDLQDLTSVERQAKAALVKSILKNSKQGRELLESLDVSSLPKLA